MKCLSKVFVSLFWHLKVLDLGAKESRKNFFKPEGSQRKKWITEVIRNTQRRMFCAVDFGMFRISGKSEPDNTNDS